MVILRYVSNRSTALVLVILRLVSNNSSVLVILRYVSNN